MTKDTIAIDIGKHIAKYIHGLKSKKRLHLKVGEYLDILLENPSEIIMIKNLAILFEAELKLDIPAFFNKYSKNQVLIIEWLGEIEGNTLYFLTKKGISIDLSGIVFEVLETLDDEI